MMLSLSSARLILIRHLGSVRDIPRGRQQWAEYISICTDYLHLIVLYWIWEKENRTRKLFKHHRFVSPSFYITFFLYHCRFVSPCFCIIIFLYHHLFVSPSFCITVVLYHHLFVSSSFCITIFLYHHLFVSPSFCIAIFLYRHLFLGVRPYTHFRSM